MPGPLGPPGPPGPPGPAGADGRAVFTITPRENQRPYVLFFRELRELLAPPDNVERPENAARKESQDDQVPKVQVALM